MFIHESHLPQVLSPECYFSAEQHERELATVFEPAWHYVASLSDFPEDGSFVTCELFGRPLILWRVDGQIQAFLNVCAHRFSTLQTAACGTASRIKCPYHGWEYDQSGNTCRIPDAKSFRPMGNAARALVKYPTETRGDLVFVRLTEAGPSLSDSNKKLMQFCDESLTGDFDRNLTLDWDVDANWKIVVENAIESYHVAFVHQATFGGTPPEEMCEHKLEKDWTSFQIKLANGKQRKPYHPLEGFVYRVMGHRWGAGYYHCFCYPNVLVSAEHIFRTVMIVTPLSPTRCRMKFHMFAQRGTNRNAFANFVFRQVCRFAARFTTRVMQEDRALWPGLQVGLQSPQRPSPGLISAREERVFHFQQHIHDLTQQDQQPERSAA